jgi:hypothetical protein
MRFFILCAALFVLAACTSAEPTPTATPIPAPTFTPILAATDIPSPPAFQIWSSSEVVDAIKAAGLEIGATRPMTRGDYGLGPLVAIEGTRFLLPSLGEDNGGRIVSFATPEDLDKLRSYYVDIGKASAILFSHVFVKDNIIVQINGDLSDEQAARYDQVLQAMTK